MAGRSLLENVQHSLQQPDWPLINTPRADFRHFEGSVHRSWFQVREFAILLLQPCADTLT